MSRKQIIEFFRSPLQFAAGVSEKAAALWLAALDEVVFANHNASEPALRQDQIDAWRGVAPQRLALLLGPPGTGKTFTLSWMAAAYIEITRRRGRSCRVLLTGFTRNSILNLLEAVQARLQLCSPPDTKLVWLGNEPPETMPNGVELVPVSQGSTLSTYSHAIVASTAWSLYRALENSPKLPLQDGRTAQLFDLVCIDEASQMVVSQGLMSLAGLSADGRVLVAGDNRQLAPVRTVHEVSVDGREIGGSLYNFLVRAGVPEFALGETFRLSRPIAEFPAEQFYEGRLRSVNPERKLELREGWEQGLEAWERAALDPEKPVCIFLHDGPPAGTQNSFEAKIIARLVERFHDRMTSTAQPLTNEEFWSERLAVVTPHRAQNAAIRALLESRGLADSAVVDTVDRIQGRERDAILACYTVSDAEFALAEAPFIFSRERLNVMITRARMKLVLVLSRHLLEVIPEDEDVFDAAQVLREFVFSSEDMGAVHLPGEDSRPYPAAVRVRRFDSTQPLPTLKPTPTAPVAADDGPILSRTDEDLLNAIRRIALTNTYGNAPEFALRRELGRSVQLSELRRLLLAGHITLNRPTTFWTAKPLNPPRRPFAATLDVVRQRIDGVIQATRRGRFAPFYNTIRERFEWVGEDGQDVLKAILDQLASEGCVKWGEYNSSPTIDYVVPAPPSTPPVLADSLGDEDFEVLNCLEEIEARRINFGVFEHWSSVREIARKIGRSDSNVSASVLKLAKQGWLVLTDSGQVRSRVAELAREVRNVKQRFQQGDAARRPYLVRAVKLELRNREKPERNELLSEVERACLRSLGSVHGVENAVKAVGAMLRRRWANADPKLAGFQRRAFERLLGSWLGAAKTDAYVITAETGTGKTEAAILPLIAGALIDRMRNVQGTRVILVYPRIRLAANQAQRIAAYLADLATTTELPLLTIGMQNQEVPTSFDFVNSDNERWRRASKTSFSFPFFQCPEHSCNNQLLLSPGHGKFGADRLQCSKCNWSYDGWVGTKAGIRRNPPAFFVTVTESLHHWLHRRDSDRLFGDTKPFSPPRAVIADEIHLYSHAHGAQVAHVLRRLFARAQVNADERKEDTRTPIAIGMSATLGKPERVWQELSGRSVVECITPEAHERRPNPRGREYFYFIQPEVESRGKDIAGASTTIQSVMCLAHGMRRRPAAEGGFRGVIFLDSIDKLKRLHSDYRDAEEGRRLADLRTRLYDDDLQTGLPRRDCCRVPEACDRFKEGECWFFAATDSAQRMTAGAYRPGIPLAVCSRPVFSGTGGADDLVRASDLVFSTSSLEVGFDDPEMSLVYQHYAPINVASFIQRKGRGGRGTDDRPVTGLTLSIYSARDSWFFRHPQYMLDATQFEIPLNVKNYFVVRGQVISLLLDLYCRRLLEDPNLTLPNREFFKKIDPVVRRAFGDDIYSRLEVSGLEALWKQATAEITSRRNSAKDWADNISWVPATLFQSGTLPVINVGFESDNGAHAEKIEPVNLALSECAPGNMTRRFGFSLVHWLRPVVGRHPMASTELYARWRRFQPLTGGSGEDLLNELPIDAASAIGRLANGEVVKIDSLEMGRAGRFAAADWQPDWSYDRVRRTFVPYRPGIELPTVNHKSEAALRGYTVVEASDTWTSVPTNDLKPLIKELEIFRSATNASGRSGLRVSRIFWGTDSRLILDEKRSRDEEYVTQIFAHPDDQNIARSEDRRCLPIGYEVSTEGIRVRLDTSLLDRFISLEVDQVDGKLDGRWLRGQFLRYLLVSHCTARSLNGYQSRQVADLIVSAAGFPDSRAEVGRLLQRWNTERFGELLSRVYADHLRQHPLLTERRVQRIRNEILQEASFADALRRSWEEVRSNDAFMRYLRSTVLQGVAVRLWQAFVLHGRGDERQIILHVKLPIQFANRVDDTITIAEDGNGGDGTTRTFLEHQDEALGAFYRRLAVCPNHRVDEVLDLIFERDEALRVWKLWNPRQEDTVRKVAAELDLDPVDDSDVLQAIVTVVYGSEEIGAQRFDLYDLHREIHQVREILDQQTGREPSAWELVGEVVALVKSGDARLPNWIRLLQAYGSIDDAIQEESLSAEARLADQAYRLSARLCVDGCQACLHAGASARDAGIAELTVSRRVLGHFADFVLALR